VTFCHARQVMWVCRIVCVWVHEPHVPGSAGSENWVQVALSCIINHCTRWMMFCHRYAAGSSTQPSRNISSIKNRTRADQKDIGWSIEDGERRTAKEGICQLQKQVKIFIKVKIVAQLVGGRWERWVLVFSYSYSILIRLPAGTHNQINPSKPSHLFGHCN